MKNNWFFDNDFNGVPDEILDDVVEFFDFPNEDVETDAVEHDWNDQLKHLEEPSLGIFPVPSSELHGETQNEKPNPMNNFAAAELSHIDRRNVVNSSLKVQPALRRKAAGPQYCKPIPIRMVSFNGTNLRKCQTYSPVSVFESSSYSSVENFNFELPKRPRSKRQRLSSFDKLFTIPFISTSPAFQKHQSEKQHAGKSSSSVQRKPKKKDISSLSDGIVTKRPSLQDSGTPRKCMHCEITKTPQWREGPKGPRTLCNACGVRYRSGRLFPEYRPAASPTFEASLHSNSHKKVLEIRKQELSHIDRRSIVNPSLEDQPALQRKAAGPQYSKPIPIRMVSFNGTNLRKCQTYSPVSVSESSSYSSVENFNFELPKRPRSKHQRLSSFDKLFTIPFISTSPAFQKHQSEKQHAGKSSSRVQRKPKKNDISSLSDGIEMKTSSIQDSATPRKCMHCEVTETPQWREGPKGPRTLCNACGVRYRSGRLFPEYRPAASPTFEASLHSNSHRNVLEIRKKELSHIIDRRNIVNPSLKEQPALRRKAAGPQYCKPIPIRMVSFNGTNLRKCQTDSPVSVFESSSYSSVENFNSELPKRPHSKRQRLSSFDKLFTIPFISTSPVFQKHQSEKQRAGKSPSRVQRKPKKNDISSLSDGIEMKSSSIQDSATPRKCMHCEVTKTPQWRQGPKGLTTLCNACGVRYRSGRLFPEYRPAASPTFEASLHSNSHQKVLEIRKQVS